MAGLRIFETDPEAAPKRRQFTQDTVGRFRSGRMVGTRPEALTEWRVTTGDPTVADAIVQLYGGVAEEWETSGEDGIEVLTNAKSVGIVLDGTSAIKADMRQYSNGTLFHHCDGVEMLSPEEERGAPCGCPRELKARKALAKKGGPKPNTEVRFRLSDDPDLGLFRFVSASWDLAKSLPHVLEDMDAIDGGVRATLAMEQVSFEAKSGPMAGTTVTYTKPVIDVRGSWSEDDKAPF